MDTLEEKEKWGYLKTRLVMVVVKKLVDDQKSRPVGAARKCVCVGTELSEYERGSPNKKLVTRIANKLFQLGNGLSA